MSGVLILTPNPALDLGYRVDRQRIGVTQRVREVTTRPGGKGVNVARVLNTLGIPVTTIQPLGGPTGDRIETALRDRGIPVVACPIRGETRRTVTVHDGIDHPTMLGEPGPVITTPEWAALSRLLLTRLATHSTLVIAGSLPPETDTRMVGDWIRLAQTQGVHTVVDVSGAALISAAQARADVLAPNAAEAMEATGTHEVDAAATALLALGARTVVLSRGAEGLRGYTAAGTRSVPAVPGISGNPTGAGDAVTAGLVRALEAGADLLESLEGAAALGAAAVLSPVAGELDPADADRFDALLHTSEASR
ncbi:1-phosphofructokinase family hexose kinase [Mycetocola sp. BIGb0189]|uniref:1-phosphofructokinase family hexose kinase n=1 Tax=Mycetocola sp. BIGb0189 TaxID=2940604 RepID=UPI0021676D20|nr:hexose kinase [Mycetocola sp. BIGb0189]MCS4277823.1 1-phosphofructokinase family hexose kinase [Mycetocola sp. BIGb0189]